jgi:hypothetical protein
MDSSGELAIKIGDLFIRSNILTIEELEDAVKLADKMRQPLGRILQMNGYCSEANLEDTLNIQQRINDKTLTLESGVKAVEMVIKQGLEVDAAIRRLNPVATKRQELREKNIVGDMLAMTNIITQKQFTEAINHSLDTRLPLGTVLVNIGAVSVHVLECAVTLLEYTRDGVINKEQATHAMRLARFKSLSAQDALIEDMPGLQLPERDYGLKEVLVLAGVISENQLLVAREIELVEKQPLLTTLVDIGSCSHLCLDAAQQMMQMISEDSLTFEQGLMILRKLKNVKSEEEMEEILGSMDELEGEEERVVEVADVLLAAGLVGAEEINIATPLALQSKKSLNRVLIDAGFIDERTGVLVNGVKELLQQNILGIEQAKIALIYSIENNAMLDDTLRLFGWWQTIASPY